MRKPRPWSPIVLAALVLGGGACPSLERGAKEQFSTDLTCPEDRIEVRRRPELKPYDVAHPRPPEPPADVRSDPGRLAMWQKNQEDTRDTQNRHKVLEARGCGQSRLYICDTYATHSSTQSPIGCSEIPYPSGVPRW